MNDSSTVRIEEGIKELSFFAYERSHLIGKKRVKTDVPKAQFIVAPPHLRLPIRPQRERRMSASHGVLPKMRERLGWLRKTACKVGHVFSSAYRISVTRVGFGRAQSRGLDLSRCPESLLELWQPGGCVARAPMAMRPACPRALVRRG